MNTIYQNQVFELTVLADRQNTDPILSHDLFGEFTTPSGTVLRVPAFWAGKNEWKIRYASHDVGEHRYRIIDSDGIIGADGADGEQSGVIRVTAYEGENPLYKHGAIGRQGTNLFLTHEDGKPFFWLADTWWMALTERLGWPDDFMTLVADRVDKGFSVVQLVAGLYPDMLPFDKRGRNEGGFPWDESFQTLNPVYFDQADKRIQALVEAGIIPCVVGSWGFFMKFAGKAALLRHWRNLIARWAAYPVAWCVAGEANMAFYDDPISPEEHLRQSRRDWNDVTAYIRSIDAFDRLVTIHPTANGHEQIEDETLLDLDMLQTGHGGPTSIVPTLRQLRRAIARKKHPVINAEVCYEGICGSSYADVQRYLFLSNIFLGACGHTYGANGIWQVNAAGRPYGVSPHGAQWGETSWQDASQLPGSGQIGSCKRYLQQFDWWRFEQHPEWVERPCSGEAMDGHFATGIPGEVRLVFKPHFGGDFWGQIKIYGIEPDVTYRSERMNPITGDITDLGVVKPDPDGTWRTPRVDAFQDWIFALIRL